MISRLNPNTNDHEGLLATVAVWNELAKENKEFFEAYAESQNKGDRMSEEETSQLIQKMISDSSKDSDD